MQRTTRLAAVALTLTALLAGGCEMLDDAAFEDDFELFSADPADALDVGATDATRDDVDCSRSGLGEDASAVYLTAYVVVDGELGAVCLGEPDPVLENIWASLAAMAPAELREDLSLFTLFEGGEESDDVTLAFVITADDEGRSFQMSFNAEESQADPDELLLTIAHEFSHVFTGTLDELDRVMHPDDCTTYDNGEGCYLDGSMMLGWIETFWSDEQIGEVDPNEEAQVADGEERCAADPGFFGDYAASTPEEDFAEAFSAFVLRIEPNSDAQAARLGWFESWPLLTEVRDRAAAAALGPLDNRFGQCGTDV
jgi:hypothetical protein